MQESTEPLIVDFSAESRGCAPCLLLSPQLELIAKEYEGRMRVVKIDTDKCQALTSQMKVDNHAVFFLKFDEAAAFLKFSKTFLLRLHCSRDVWVRGLKRQFPPHVESKESQIVTRAPGTGGGESS